MRFLVCGDFHLKPAASDYDLDSVVVPDNVDAALIIGDLTHRAESDDIILAGRFVERLESTVPVIYVPGNHDHAPAEQRVVEPFSSAHTGHRTVHRFDSLTMVGWGCEDRSLSPAIDQTAFDALDPRTEPQRDRRYFADEIADDIEAACYDVICEGKAPRKAVSSLGIHESDIPALSKGLETVQSTYEHLAELLQDRKDVLLATHVPPFNTSFDRHHAVGNREEDLEYLHMGSIALKLAIRNHDVFASISGHSHTYGFESGGDGDGRPYYLNLGYRGIATVTIEPDRGQFSYTKMTEAKN